MMTEGGVGKGERDAYPSRLEHAGLALTDAESAGLRRSRLAKAAVQPLSLSDITAEIQRLPEGAVGFLARHLKTRGKAPTPAIAQALRTFLAKENEERSILALHDGLYYGVVSTSYVSVLEDDELAALLAARRDKLGFLVGQPLREALTAPEEFGVTVTVRAAVWSSMACAGREGSIAALAWLVADPPASWSEKQAAAVAETWAAVRKRYPMLPEHPASIEQLCSTVAEMERSGLLDELASASAAVNTDDHLNDADVPEKIIGLAASDKVVLEDIDTLGRLTDLSARIDAQESDYAQVRDVDLSAIVAAINEGLIPPADELARLDSLQARMTALLTEVTAVTGGPMPRTMADAAEQVEEMREALTTDSALGRIRLLAGLVAPGYAAVEAAEIRERAAAVDAQSDPALISALDALVTLIGLGSSDPKQSAELSRIVQPLLPGAGVLIMLAGGGHVHLDVTGASDPHGQEMEASASATDCRSSEDVGAGGDVAAEHAGINDPSQLGKSGNPDVIAEAIGTDSRTELDATDAVTAPFSHDAPADGSARATVRAEPDLDDVLAEIDFAIPAPTPAKAATPATAMAEPAPASSPTEAAPSNIAAALNEGVRIQDPEIDSTALYVGLLKRRQFALAGSLADATRYPSAVSGAHRLAAYATAMRGSAGPNAAAFADEIKTLDADTLAPLTGAQMLVYSASVHAGLLSPAVGAAGSLRDLTPSITKAGAAVEELTEALLVTFYSGAHLTARSADVIAEAAGIETQHTALAMTARDLLRTAGSRTIRYQAATQLWKLWMEPNGYLGTALAIVAAGSRSEDDLRSVRSLVTELRSRSTLEKAILAYKPTARSKQRIEARARDKIIDWAGDVADVLADWVANIDEISRTAAGGGWMAAQITQLRDRVSRVRSDALAELEALAMSTNEARNAAVYAGIALLSDALDLISGEATVDAGIELPADREAYGSLILADSLPVEAAPVLRPGRTVIVADIASAARALADGPTGWTSAFNRRSEKGDHVGTHVLLEILRSVDSGLARRLSAARDRDIDEAVSALDAEVAALATRIDSDRLFGRLTGDQWTDLSTRARAYESETRDGRLDFDVMRATLADVENDRDAWSLETIEAAWERMGDLELTDEQRRRVSDCIERRDLTTADEYLETIRVKGELPENRNDADHLKWFFPAFPALFSAAGRNSSALLNDLKRAIDNGENPDGGRLGEVLASAAIDVSAIVRNLTASTRVDHWLKLAAARTLEGRVGNVKPILEQLGYIVADTRIPPNKAGRSPGGRSAWMYLSGVRATSGKALIPEFGTRMSPSGDTLRLLAVWGAPTAPEIVEQLRSEPVEHSVIVLYFGALSVSARNEFALAVRGGRKLPPTIVIDDPMFAYLAAQPTPRRDITMSVALPFASAEPFTPDVAGLVPEEMFYGRAEELDQVVNMMGSCIVYGGRQLGKSALLRAAAREFVKGTTTKRAIYQSIYRVGQAVPVDAVWPTLWPRLAERGIVPGEMPAGDVAGAVVRHITGWISADSDRQLLLLLDESDFFLDADARNGSFRHVTIFKELMEATGRAVKVVFAGLHQTARFERLSNHPLAHLGNPVCVGPLTPQYAYDLLTRPLHTLGYRFTDKDDAARVLALANNQPALIQLFGAQLLRRLQKAPPAPNTPPRTVTAADVAAVWADEALRTELRRRFDWTLNLDPRYKIIAYAVAFHAYAHGIESTLSPTALRSQCEQWWPRGFTAKDVLTGEFRALLDECVALGVLSYNSEGAYRLRTPNVLTLLGSRDEVDHVLDQAEAQELPESFDGSLLRPTLGTSQARSPLTSAQISDLLGPGSRVRVIVGSAALTVERCAQALSDRNENAAYGNASLVIKETTAAGLISACRQVAESALNISLVLVDLKGATREAAVTAWEEARDQIAEYSAGTLSVILLTTPAQAAMWVRCDRDADQSSGLTELHRYDSVGLRLSLTETALPFQDEASRAELLEVTGGWPILVNRLLADPREQDRGAAAELLEPIRHWLVVPANADALVEACGLRADDTLTQAWSFLVTVFGNEAGDLDNIDDWLTIAAEDAPALTIDGLAANGYGSTLEVAQILRMLGVLVTSPDDGQLRLEPVVAAATRTAVGYTGTTGVIGGTGD
jgi:hypothetical protein